ncbi:NADH:ubiquinone oxidoreductase subunit A [Salmonella enterica subsp. enterica serovar Heidelberg str. RI-11-014316]|nr:NADH:ubiquinone oxidoreductase subunit A [Salmonella enterica subsp. enterica serovar Heidelberg str. RI-11-014316]
MLLAGLVYLARIGALDWTPARSRRERMNPETTVSLIVNANREALRWIIRSPA